MSPVTTTRSSSSTASAARRAGAARSAGEAAPGAKAEPRLSYLVKQLELAIRADMDANAREHGLTALQYTALTVLQRQPGMSGAQLSRRSFVSPQAGSEMVAHLERKALIVRAPDADNRRILRISLTAAGEHTVRECDRWMDGLETRMLAGLSAAETRALRTILTACERNLQYGDGAPT
jgi:DNA-binding MarR family transcriptional regulator